MCGDELIADLHSSLRFCARDLGSRKQLSALALREHLSGNLERMNQNAIYYAMWIERGLIHKVEKAGFQSAVAMAIDLRR